MRERGREKRENKKMKERRRLEKKERKKRRVGSTRPGLLVKPYPWVKCNDLGPVLSRPNPNLTLTKL